MELIVGFLLDRLLGDPHRWYHPVRSIGTSISVCEKYLRKIFPQNRKGELAGGIVLAAVILTGSGMVPWILLILAERIHPWMRFCLGSVMCYQLLAARSLKDESMHVYQELERGDLEGARKAVSMIVGRDTEQLTEEGIIKAAVETVAENTSDGVIAPLLYMAVGGPVAGFLYKGINTMDSMVGYHNAAYEYFGKAGAKLDDVVNWIPARLSAAAMIVAAAVKGMDWKQAIKIYRRDRKNHKSPNSAQTEAVCAGALGVELAGNAFYFGKLVEKPVIGDPVRPVEKEDIPRAGGLMYATEWIVLGLAVGIRAVMFLLGNQ